MRRSQMKQYQTFKAVDTKDREGIVNNTYLTDKKIIAEVWEASGKVQAEMYGLRLAYMKNMITDLNNEVAEEMALGIENQSIPDYKIVSKKKYSRHIRYELERLI